MGIVELLLIAVGLSLDAFAVAIGKGLGMTRLNGGQALIIAVFFGGFQALMPLLGWALGVQFEQFVSAVEGWIAFGLLAFIGAKMIWDAFHEGDGEDDGEFKRVILSIPKSKSNSLWGVMPSGTVTEEDAKKDTLEELDL